MTEQPDPITRVIFRIWRNGEVIALMPDDPFSHYGDITSYMHIGQHGAATYDLVVGTTRPATVAEYSPLLAELTRIGYNVCPIARYTRPRRRTV